MHFHYLTNLTTFSTGTPALVVMKFKNLVDFSLVILAIYSVCLIFAYK